MMMIGLKPNPLFRAVGRSENSREIVAPFYSAPSIFAVFRNLAREIWFEKSGSRKVVDQKKKSELVEPLF